MKKMKNKLTILMAAIIVLALLLPMSSVFGETCSLELETDPRGNNLKSAPSSDILNMNLMDYNLYGDPETSLVPPSVRPESCERIFQNHAGNVESGYYGISPDGRTVISAYCYMTDEQGWTIIDPNHDPNWKNFFKEWVLYKGLYGEAVYGPGFAQKPSPSHWKWREWFSLADESTIFATSPNCKSIDKEGKVYRMTGNYYGCRYYNRNCDFDGECHKCRDDCNRPEKDGTCPWLICGPDADYDYNCSWDWWNNAPSLGAKGDHCVAYSEPSTIQGGLGVAVLPLFSNLIAGDTVDLTVKILSTENFDDKLDVYLSTEGLDNPVDLGWFNWINKNEVPICTDLAKQWQPDIYEDKIVYMDNRNGNWDIYMYDLSDDSERQITNDPSTQEEPSIYGDKIVWTDWRNGNTDIGIYYLSTDEEILKTIDPIAQENPEIYGDNVVYESYRNGNWDIYMIDLPYTCRRITSDPATQSSPAIYGDKIVYQDDRNGNWDIYLYDLSTGTETQITTDPAGQTSPDIYGDKIVYSCDGSVYVYDLSTHCTEKQITHECADLGHTKIYGDKIVYSSINHNRDIYMYDLSIDKETRITTDPAEQWLPAIYGDKIVYNDLRNSNWDIYMYDLSGTAIPAGGEITIPAGGEITIPLRAVIPPGESGIKMFRVIAESTIWRTEGFGTGIFGIT